MFDALGQLVARYWPGVIVAWLAIAAALWIAAPRWEQIAHDGDLDHLPADMPSVRGSRLLADGFAERKARSEMVLIAERRDGPLTADDFEAFDALVDRLATRSEELTILDVWNHATPMIGKKLTSATSDRGQATLAVFLLANDLMAVDNIRVLGAFSEATADFHRQRPPDNGLRVGLTGSAAVGGDMLDSARESIQNTELTTIFMVLAILLIVYRAPLLMLVPLVTMAVSVLVSIHLLALLTQLNVVPGFGWWNLKVFTTTRIFIVVILFGAGTDYCLFLISRYREHLQAGLGRREALSSALGRVGDALAASALTTIVGLGMMVFSEFGKFRHSGVSISLSLAVTLAAATTLAPALLMAMGRFVFWPFATTGDRSQPSRFTQMWDSIARATIARPGLVLVVSCLLLAPLAYAGYTRSDVTYDLLSELAPHRASVQGTRMLERHFPPGETSPLVVLAHLPGGGLDETEARYDIIHPLWRQLSAIDGVQSARSLTRPLGDSEETAITGSRLMTGRLGREGVSGLLQARLQYLATRGDLAGELTRFDIILQYAPFSKQAIGALERIEQQLHEVAADPNSPWHGAEFSFAGTTAGIRDLKQVTTSDQQRIQWTVVLAVLAVLLAILRRPLICVYLILSVLLTYFVTIGAAELVFAQAYGETFDGLDWKVPIFLFVLLIAIGQDYNVYLVTRIIEEQRRSGLNEGLRVAMVRTGGIITSCGVIMAATFISMMTGSLRFMVELGFALSLGVMLDTLVVRPILVPAFVALLDRLKNDKVPKVQMTKQ